MLELTFAINHRATQSLPSQAAALAEESLTQASQLSPFSLHTVRISSSAILCNDLCFVAKGLVCMCIRMKVVLQRSYSS